jgi:hypothetical protein
MMRLFLKKPIGKAPRVQQKLRGWSEHVASWRNQKDIPVHLIRYEDLRKDTARMLRRALAFAGLPATDEDNAPIVEMKKNQGKPCREQESALGEAFQHPRRTFIGASIKSLSIPMGV